MGDLADRYAVIADGMSARVDAVGDWSVSSPCPGWTARDVVEHVVQSHRRALERVAVELPATAPDDDPGHDPTPVWHTASRAMLDALGDDDIAARTIETPFGTAAFSELVGSLICSDTLVHTWDLARATGQDERLDPGAVEATWTAMQRFGEGLRTSGAFGDEVAAPADADAQTRLLAFLGRRV